ncbi:putative NBD/HSP70 family sugar kinase [Catenuloplanes nepalensis]|uniref:NBD/HSP70 family sugar kinase n=1 Tax=Catenuloplanes nepalensis TaxID=587533 RepID=A0ABT9MKU5_9ACTN|nr:ROK family transcriptional regulator [Catenuloplanes nepalensis]MDP9792044.1 putative NBD/HSP70 family sugar kinase [Catenuloplanes nepalensis]
MQTGPQPADFADVRATNLAVVLRHVRAHGPVSRAGIAAATGLNKATVSSLVADLIERRLLRETGLAENRIGRPATMLVLDGSAYAAIGIEVNGDHLTAVAVDLAGEQLLFWRRAFTGRVSAGVGAGRGVSAIAALAGRAASRAVAQGRQVLGLTVGVPGLVDEAGAVRRSDALGWTGVDLRGDLLKALRKPEFDVAVDNDANLAALAEQRYGGHRGARNLIYVAGETGLGAGLIVDGRLLRGGRGFTGEIGRLQLHGGTLQELAGIESLIQRALPDADAEGPITDFAPEVERVAAAARAGDAHALAALRDVGRHLGHGLSLLASLLDPEVIVLGGYFVPLTEWLLPAARAEMTATDTGGVTLIGSAIGPGAAATGGAARVLDALDAGVLPTLTA